MSAPSLSLRVRALRLLAAREHSRAELKRKLSDDEAAASELDALLEEFARNGWLSEKRLAEQMVESARGRYGGRRVLDRLRQKGLDEDALGRAAQVLLAQELESARVVWGKRFGRLPADLRAKAKQARFLAGRGFSTEVIRQVLGSAPEE